MENMHTSEIEYILGVDFGMAKIGLALADTETRIAFSFCILKNGKDVFAELEKIILEKNIQKVIVGKAFYNQIDSKNDVEVFCKNLQKTSKVEIVFAEEMFSTLSAQKNLHEACKKNINQDDAESARIILQEWLDKK